MYRLTTLTTYEDELKNSVQYDGEPLSTNINVTFKGTNNQLIVETPARIDRLTLAFDCNNAIVRIASNSRKQGSLLRLSARVGEDCSIRIGKNVTMTATCFLTAAEGTSITIGNDCMIASNNEIRTHDGHPIFDVRSGKRTNTARSISIGNHVWLAKDAVVLSGAEVGDGSVIGHRSVVTKKIPNNCIAVGAPARVVRRDIAWERPNLTMTEPFYKPDVTAIKKSRYWAPTASDAQKKRSLFRRAASAVRRHSINFARHLRN
ncbi:acyltransferase [Paramicrobacterium chengjingii]|uniref:acyltransferase n=1 Tax=Paramicrobacterium chengjingii TaxID=2769067 RepID=UPI001AB060BA